MIPNGETRYHQEWHIKDVKQAISELQFCFDSPETTCLLPDALTIGHHTFNLDNLSKVVLPDIPAGKHVFVHGKGM